MRKMCSSFNCSRAERVIFCSIPVALERVEAFSAFERRAFKWWEDVACATCSLSLACLLALRRFVIVQQVEVFFEAKKEKLN